MSQPPRKAKITWSPERVAAGLPEAEKLTRPTKPGHDAPSWGEDMWSLVCVFEPPAASQGNPSLADVSFLMPAAPHGRLEPGAKLLMHDATFGWADIEILS